MLAAEETIATEISATATFTLAVRRSTPDSSSTNRENGSAKATDA